MTTNDFDKFWHFSCWFIPISVIISKLLHSTYFENSNAGLYSSVKALSIVLIIQFTLSIYYARQDKKQWVAMLLNIVAIVLLGTKSLYLYMAAIVITLLIIYSKHRARMICVIIIGGIGVYYIIFHFFSNELVRILDYQTTHFSAARANNTIVTYLFSGRNEMLIQAWDGLRNNGLQVVAILFGVGRGNLPNGIEIDLFEILLSFGIIVTSFVYFLVLIPFVWKNKDKKSNKDKALFITLALICMVIFSTLGGHTFLEAIAATYSAILISYKYSIKNETMLFNLLNFRTELFSPGFR